MEPLTLEDCIEIERASEKHMTALPMEPGDVLLLDNYRGLHGRDVFEGDRYHAVSWFTWKTALELVAVAAPIFIALPFMAAGEGLSTIWLVLLWAASALSLFTGVYYIAAPPVSVDKNSDLDSAPDTFACFFSAWY